MAAVRWVFIIFAAVLLSNATAARAGEIKWENQGQANNTTYASGSTATSGGATLTTTWTTVTDGGTFDGGGSVYADFVTYYSGILGNHAGLLLLSFENSTDDPDDKIILNFNFDQAVTNLSFSILDIDYDEPNDLQDFVEVEYHTGDNNWINLTTTAFWTLGGNSLERDDESFGEGWEGRRISAGHSGSAYNSVAGNLNIAFGGIAVRAVRIRYFSGDDEPNPNTVQEVGISDLSFNDLADPLIVTSTADTNTVGTLRYAINYANANPVKDAITFNIAGSGPHVITAGTVLPTVTDANISIDGTTQAGASCGNLWAGTPHTIKVRIDSGNAGNPGFSGLNVSAASFTLKGVSVTRFTHGIDLLGGSSNAKLQCSYFGLVPNGTTAGNYDGGIFVRGSGAQIGGLSAGQGNVISSNVVGIFTESGSSATIIQGNFIGTDPTGTSLRTNNYAGINHSSGMATWFEIRKNLISGNSLGGIVLDSNDIISGSSGDLVIAGNHIGMDRTGLLSVGNFGSGIVFADGSISGVTIGGTSANDRNVISGNVNSGISLGAVSSVNILGNYIGIGSDGATVRGNGTNGISINNASNITVGGALSGAGNVVSSNTVSGINISASTGSISIFGNIVGSDASGKLARGNGGSGIQIAGSAAHMIGNGFASGSNIVAFSGGDGIRIKNSGTKVAILANSIFSNGLNISNEIGIDIEDDGVTLNDVNDSDGGANNRLNFPQINGLEADGTTTLAYNLNLDLPANGQGYRIDFFKNSTPDSAGYGQGEIWLGSTNINHTGGDLNFSGFLSANTVVNIGDSISATTTRITATGYDLSSEFNLTEVTVQRQGLAVTLGRTVFDLEGLGLFSIPGNDHLVNVNIVNKSKLPTTNDSIEVILDVPAETLFYFGDVDGAGPETDPIAFDGTNAPDLTFTYATDVRYSDNPVQPGFADCSYTPVAGYDPAVTFICVNPKGVLAAGDPNFNFNLTFRQRIP